MMKRLAWMPGVVALCLAVPAQADSILVDKIYHPYVQTLEQEVEWRMSMQDHQPGVSDHVYVQRLGYARSLGSGWSGEIYLVGESAEEKSFDVEAYELEARRQLTEQGEYWADLGVVFELEKTVHSNAWRFSTGLLAEKELGKWSGTVNFFLSQAWGPDNNDNIEARLNLQARYRRSPLFEPAFEYYSDKDTRGVGPVALGSMKLAARHQLTWEAGAIFGLDHSSPNLTLRVLLGFEF